MKTITLTQDGRIDPLSIQVTNGLAVGALLDLVRKSAPYSDGALFLFREGDEDSLEVSHVLNFDALEDVLHVARRKLVNVTIHFQSNSLCLRVPPSTRVRRVRREAIDYFKIAPSDAARLVLIKTGTSEPLDLMLRVGSLTDDCEISLDLVPHSKIQG